MERLTVRNSDGAWDVPLRDDDGVYIPSQEVIDRLAAYEDTGLTPEGMEAVKTSLMGKSLAEIKEIQGVPVERMIEWAKAESDGRLIVLPCKAGEPCFRIYTCRCGCRERCKKKKEAKLIDVVPHPYAYVYYCKRIAESKFTLKDIANFGKTVFLTREEAEAALKREV